MVLGTRPEAVKLAPVAAAFRQTPWATPTIIDTGQQPDLFGAAAAALNLRPDVCLAAHRPGQTLSQLSATLSVRLNKYFRRHRPHLVMVQGDTQSAAMAALTAAHLAIPVAHVEAGLRSGNITAPFPEELNRRLIAQTATLHFAPTVDARDNLLRENIHADGIVITGNTVIDSLCAFLSDKETRMQPRAVFTCHRRESWGKSLGDICDATLAIAARHPGLGWDVVLPLAPQARRIMQEKLGQDQRFHLRASLPYDDFIALLQQARLVITDSGGVTEEAATLGTPTVVVRNELDRPEALRLANVALAGTAPQDIINKAEALLSQAATPRNPRLGPFGDGQAAARIIATVNHWRLGLTPLLAEADMFHPPTPRLARHG